MGRRVLVTVAMLLVLLSCGRDEVPDVLAFSAPRVGGGTISGADYAGRPVAFWFWAPG